MRFTQELANSYLGSNYWIFLETEVVSFKPWREESAVTALHELHNTKTSALISAYNPLSDQTSAAQNRKAHQHLLKDIEHLPFYAAQGSSHSSKLRAEKSFLVVGINREQARSLGKKYKQHAIVFFQTRRHKTIPSLVAIKHMHQAKLDLAHHKAKRILTKMKVHHV